MKDEELFEKLKASDLPQPYKKYADAIGIDNLIKLSDMIGGKEVYFPTPLSLYLTSNRNEIVREYMEGASVNSLADKYNISCKSIYRYIKQYKDNNT